MSRSPEKARNGDGSVSDAEAVLKILSKYSSPPDQDVRGNTLERNRKEKDYSPQAADIARRLVGDWKYRTSVSPFVLRTPAASSPSAFSPPPVGERAASPPRRTLTPTPTLRGSPPAGSPPPAAASSSVGVGGALLFATQEVSRLQEALSQARRELDTVCAENRRLRITLQSESEMKSSYFNEAVGARRQAQEQVERLQEDKEALQRKASKAAGEAAELHAELERSRVAMRLEQAAVRDAHDTHHRDASRASRAEAEAAGLRADLQRRVEELADREAALADLTLRVADLEFQLKVEREARHSVEAEAEALKQAMERLRREAGEELEGVRRQLLADLAAARTSGQERIQAVTRAYEQQMDTTALVHQEAMKRLHADLEKAEQLRGYAQTEAKQAAADLAKAERERHSLSTEVERLERRLDDWESQLRSARKAGEAQAVDVAAARAAAAAASREEAAMRRRLTEVASANADLEIILEESRRREEAAETENCKLRQQLGSLNENLWGMIRVNRELRVKRGSSLSPPPRAEAAGRRADSFDPYR